MTILIHEFFSLLELAEDKVLPCFKVHKSLCSEMLFFFLHVSILLNHLEHDVGIVEALG